MRIRISKQAWTGCLALCVLALLVAPAAADAATRHVSQDGADAGDCTTADCLTIQYAIDEALSGRHRRRGGGRLRRRRR